MIMPEFLFFIARVQYVSYWTSTNMGVAKGAHVVTEMHISWFNKEHVMTVSKNDLTQLLLPVQ